MFASSCSRHYTFRISFLAGRYLFFLQKFRSCDCNVFNNLSRPASSRLGENALSYFKHPCLVNFVNNVLDGKNTSSIPHFCNSEKKLANLVTLIGCFNESENNIFSLKELQKDAGDDHDFAKSLRKEIATLQTRLCDVEEELLNEILSNDNESITDVVVEISAGVGGQEAMLFAHELHTLYHNYFTFRDWHFDVANFEETELGGVRQSMMIVNGVGSYQMMILEGGVHRVQRIPATEKYSRMQTSTVTVAVYPQPTEVDINILPDDLKIETKTARGPGGQHVNKIQTAVRIHHLPTGIIVDCQVHRSQEKNRKIALQKLRFKLLQTEYEKRDSNLDSVRKYQTGMGGRNEKIRTYNFTQDRITDHRFHISCSSIDRYLEGNSHFQKFLDKLRDAEYQRKKEEFLWAIQAEKY